MYVGRTLHSDWYIMKKESHTRRTALSLAQMFAFLSQVMVTRRRLELRNMLTRTEGSVSRRDDFVSPEEE